MNYSQTTDANCTRRDFLRGMSAAALATLAAGEPRPLVAAEKVERSQRDKPTPASCCGWRAAWRRPKLSTLGNAISPSRSAPALTRSSAPSRPS